MSTPAMLRLVCLIPLSTRKELTSFQEIHRVTSAHVTRSPGGLNTQLRQWPRDSSLSLEGALIVHATDRRRLSSTQHFACLPIER